MTYTKVIAIEKSEMELINLLLDMKAEENAVEDAGYPTDEVIKRYTAVFDDGHFADIKLCSGQNNFFGDPVLFGKKGNEVCACDCFDSIADEDAFEFYADGNTYRVVVVEKTAIFCDTSVKKCVGKYFINPMKKRRQKITVGFNATHLNDKKSVALFTNRPGMCIGVHGITINKFKAALGLDEVTITEMKNVVY